MPQSITNKKELNEGIISYSVDLVMAFRFIKVLFQDWEKTDAFKLGIIDNNGKKLKSPKGIEEKAAYSPFMRLAFKIKRLVNAIPGGDTKLGSLAASYVMLKEHDLSELTVEQINSLFEDAPVNVAGGVAGVDKPMTKPLRRNWTEMEKFSGNNVFEVEPCTFSKCKGAKAKYERWNNYITDEDGDIGKDILKYAKTYPKKGIVLKERGTGALVYLKNS